MEKALHVKEITFRVKPCKLLFGLEFGLVYHTSPITCQSKYTQPVITVKFDISASQYGQIEVIVSQIYSKSINEKINKALELRMKLKRMHRVCRHLLNILLS